MLNRPLFGPAPTFERQSQQTPASASTVSVGTLDLTGDTAEWVLEAARKLEALGRLRTGWDSYGGLPLNRGARWLTLSVLGWLRREDLPAPAVVLGSRGSVQLEWRAKGKELDVELGNDNTFEFVKVLQSGEIQEGATRYGLSEKLQELAQWLLRG